MLCSAPQKMALLQMSKERDDIINVDTFGGAHKGSEGTAGKHHGGVRADGSHWSSFYQYDQRDGAYHHHKSQTNGDYMYTKRKDEYSRFDGYDGLALSDAFLGNYYSQVSMRFTQLLRIEFKEVMTNKKRSLYQ